MKDTILALIGAVRPWVCGACGTCNGWGSIVKDGQYKTCPTCNGRR